MMRFIHGLWVKTPTERKNLFKSLDLGGERVHVEDIKSCCDYDRRLKTPLVTPLEW